MKYKFKDVIPMEEEITNTKRQIDDIEWEGGYCPNLHKHLEHLLDQYMNGEVFYLSLIHI